MRVGLFGGSFDPPHRGHLAVARAATHRFALDGLLLAPTGRQPLKPEGANAPFADRLHMVELLCALGRAEDLPLTASSIEAPTSDGHANFTVETLRTLHSTCMPNCVCHLFVVVGQDAFSDLRRWREPEELLKLAQWIVVSRPTPQEASEAYGAPGASAADDWPALLDRLTLSPQQRTRVHRLADLHDPTSATAVRQQLAHPATGNGGTTALAELPPGIEEYIRARHLYGT